MNKILVVITILYQGYNLKDMKRTTALAANSTNNNKKKYFTLREITPQWFERLNKISNENDGDIVNELYSEINDYARCIVGGAYGYDSSYVIQGTKKYCQERVAMSGRLSYALRRYNKPKLEEIIDIFTENWNEKHIFQEELTG
jgi:hypothetical protein